MELDEAGTWWTVGSRGGRQCGAQDGEVDVCQWKRRYSRHFLLKAKGFASQSRVPGLGVRWVVNLDS